MKILQKKRAFTIVELVIVIAVIAILSSVLIPTFSELITKSKTTSDIQLVKNLNISLASYECVNDTDNMPLNYILNILDEENGINKNNIKPSSSGSILYDSYANRFLLVDKNEKVVFYDTASRKSAPNLDYQSYNYWKIYDNDKVKLESNPKFSVYWNSDDAFPLTTISTGVDLGDNNVETNLTFVNEDSYSKSIVICTNSGNLTINGYADDNGNGDVIYHYGVSNKVDIIKVGNSSYHEYGTSLETTVHSGRFVAEAGSKTTVLNVMNTVSVSPEAKLNSVISFANNQSGSFITNNSSNEIQSVLTESEQNNCVHEFEIVDSFDSEICGKCGKVIDSDHEHTYGDYVCEINMHTKICSVCNKSVSGSHESAVLPAEEATCTTSGKTEGLYCSICKYVIKAQEIINPSHSYSEDFTVDIEPSCEGLGEKSRHCLFCDSTTDVTDIEAKGHSYESGICLNCGEAEKFGSVSDFANLLSTLSDDNLTIVLDKNYDFAEDSHNFNLVLNEKLTDSTLTVIIDGDGHTIYNLNSIQLSDNAGLFGIVEINLTFKNLNIEGGRVESLETGGIGALIGFNNGAKVTLDNCSVKNVIVNRKSSDEPEGASGGLVGKISGELIITNCSVDGVELEGKNCGGLIGRIEEDSLINIENCIINNISIEGASSNSGGIIGYSKSDKDNVVIKTISGENNKISGTGNKGLIIGNGDCSAGDYSNFKATSAKLNDAGKGSIKEI